MPKRSERYDYGEKIFESNPYHGKNVEEIYKSLRWDNIPDKAVEIDAPEPLACLGTLAQLNFYPTGRKEFSESEYFIAVGAQSNCIYFIPKSEDGLPIEKIPDFKAKGWDLVSKVKETHYLSDKGSDVEEYYYHEHEGPYPTLFHHKKSGVKILVPANNKGQRSYAVIKEGIVG